MENKNMNENLAGNATFKKGMTLDEYLAEMKTTKQ